LRALPVALAFGLLGAAPPIVEPAAGGTAWTMVDIVKLDTDLETLFAASSALRGAHYGVLAIDTVSGAVLYRHAADDEIQPASTLKLLVGSVALERLGPDFRFSTTLTAASGVAVIRAGGDPFLSAADLDDAAHAVANSGVRSLQSVAVDASHDDAKPYPDGWTWDDFGEDYAPRVSAIALEENLLHLSVLPGSAPGAAATVVAASIATVLAPGAACDPTRTPASAVMVRATTGPPDSEDTIDAALDPAGCLAVVGSIPLGHPAESLDAAAYDPLLYARTTFAAALRRAGVALSAIAGSDNRFGPPDPNAAPLWAHRSPALAAFLGPRFWIPSDNLTGELLLKELGVAAAGTPGTTANGIASEKSWLQSIGVDPATVSLADGCGMSQYDRITPRDLVTILQHDWNGPNRRLVLDSLPVGGARGTIEGIAGTAAAGRVFAKTGSMMHVRGLAGYLATQRHGAVTFAFGVDDWNGDYPSLATLRAQILSRIIND
jgi:D-alanyl-D-alanine carboxypeptidase/D-alanyl-D-alanine-endopeptidase (penicillin-binding protein 4)